MFCRAKSLFFISSLFCDVTHRRLVTDVPGQPVGPETSLNNHLSTLRNITEERRYHLRHGGGLKSFWLPAAERFLRRWWLQTTVMSVSLLYSVERLLFHVWAQSIHCTISHPYYAWYILILCCLARGFLTKTLRAAYSVSSVYLVDDPPMSGGGYTLWSHSLCSSLRPAVFFSSQAQIFPSETAQNILKLT
jgi:hypothetical protein